MKFAVAMVIEPTDEEPFVLRSPAVVAERRRIDPYADNYRDDAYDIRDSEHGLLVTCVDDGEFPTTLYPWHTVAWAEIEGD